MKKSILLLSFLIASSAIGQVITYQVRGKIAGTIDAPEFTPGKSYTLDFSFNKSDLIAPELGGYSFFTASSLQFNYDNGAYVGTMDKVTALALNTPTGDLFFLNTPFSGNINFPLVENKPLLNTIPATSDQNFSIMVLEDPTGAAFTAGKFMDLSKIPEFIEPFNVQRDDQVGLMWGTAPDGQFSAINGPIDSIERISHDFSPVPEPATYGLMGSGALFGLIATRRIKRKRAAASAN